MKSMHRRIVLTVSLFVALVIGVAGVLSIRITIDQEQKNLLARMRSAAGYATERVNSKEDLSAVAALMSARITHITTDGSVLFDSDGQLGYYLDQADVSAALREGKGEYLTFSLLSGQAEVAVSQALPDRSVVRVYCVRKLFDGGKWGLFALLLSGLLGVGVLFAFLIAHQILLPIREISKEAGSIVQGDYVTSRRVQGYWELDQLVRTLQNMNSRLQETVEQLKQKSAELESIISAMINGLIAVDGQLRVVQMNQAARKMLGVTGPAEGRHVLEATGNARLEASLLDAMEKDELYTVELPVRAAPRHRLIRAYISGLEHEGAAIGAVALMEDITELRHLEQLRTDFAANVTHELKTPLTSIQGFVETLQQGAINDPEAAKKFLNIIAEETERLSRLINDVLSLSSLEAGRVRVPTERLSLGKMAQETCLILRNTANAKEITLQVEESGETYINANSDHVKQLLINLIDNAIKYTLNGGRVDVRVERKIDRVELRVKDTGIGIAKEHIPRLFERFYRVDKGRSRNMGGTGLGLAIVKHIVMDMNGDIQVQSELGVGTEFTVCLPYAKPESGTI